MKELPFTWCRWANYWSLGRRRVIKKLKQQRMLNIHLGSGSRLVRGWVNIDSLAKDGVDLQWDVRYPLPFQDGAAQMIYSEHLLEHICKEDASSLLEECYRVLEPGGVIRIGVPDAELYLRAYADGGQEFFKGLERLGGAVVPLTTPIDVINQMFRMGGHHLFAWDFSSLSLTLESIGFIGIRRWEPGRASRSEICLDDPSHAFETLYVEASKPRM